MIKLYIVSLFFVALFANPFKGSAQLLNESFEGTFPPDGWQALSLDTSAARIFTSWHKYSAGDPHTGVYSAGSNSWNSVIGALTPDSWLTTPVLSITSVNDSISYWVATGDVNFPAEHYAVLVWNITVDTVANSLTDLFKTTLYENTLTAADTAWTRHALSLSAFVGKPIVVAFRHYQSTDQFMMKIDDVSGPAIVTGLQDFKLNFKKVDCILSPNPGHDMVQVKANTKIDHIKVLSLMGQLMFDSKVGDVNYTLNTTAFPTGTYLMQVQTGDAVTVKRFIVQ